jgi:non-ribosomal peptide synthetase component F
VLDAFAARAREMPADPSLVRLAPGGDAVHVRLTWRAWFDAAAAVAAALVDDGIGPGETVALLVEHGRCWPIAELGVLLAGAATCTIPAETPEPTIARILRDVDAAGCVVEGSGALRTVLSLRRQASDLPGLWTIVTDAEEDGVHPGVRNWCGWLADGHLAATAPPVRAELQARWAQLDGASPAMVVPSGRSPAGWRTVSHGTLHCAAARSGARPRAQATDGPWVVAAPHRALSRRLAGLYAPVLGGRCVVHVAHAADVDGALHDSARHAAGSA